MQEPKIGLVVSEFNYDITRIMLEKALSHASFLGAEVLVVYKVPGAFDTPFAVKQLLDKTDVEGVAVLGAVIEGETEHDEVVAHQAARKIMDLGLEYGKPITLGIIGPGASRSQAVERAEEYSARAVESLVKMIRRKKKLEAGLTGGGTCIIE
ncbi:MAG: 6,7-dimethyl-8-ribityllumazine synthase [Desulfurococcales archaeon]|nr:6,7-dimethyl-8-ribityllumazine synthase [Desulfurococcales archaeon]